VIIRATEQWFISMDEPRAARGNSLRKSALEEIHKVKWYPPWGEDRLAGMVENRPDWCISRQRLWGVPITVVYCEKCNAAVTSPALFAKVVEIFNMEGADAWFERPVADFIGADFRCSCGHAEFRKERDILDVWFDSGSSHLAVLKKRPELTWPADVYLEGHDQHRGWFQSSLLVGAGIEGASPYRQVVTAGFIVNEAGEKMSKSRGNAVSPQDVIKQNGADIIRLWVAMIDYHDDMAWGRDILTRASEAYRKIRNTARYLLSNLSDFDPSRDAVPLDQLLDADKWVLSLAAETFERCRRAYEEYDFHVVYHRVLELCTVQLSALYLDISKDTLYCEAPASRARRSAQTAMDQILRGLVGIVAPILSFTAEEIYEAMPGEKEVSVHLTEFAQLPAVGVDGPAWDRILALREAASKVLERARAAQQIGQSLEADIALHGSIDAAALLGNVNVDLAKIFIVSHVDFTSTAAAEGADWIEIPGVGRIAITMSPARGKKCGRCWQYREEVAEDGGLCGRCQAVIDTLAPPEAPTV
jgi:isoleucyl-tRNA synthetase